MSTPQMPARRPGIDALRAYRDRGGKNSLDLSDNTSRFGIPPAAQAALRDFAAPQVARYPSAANDALREALARYVGVTPDEIVTGCGSDDVLDAALRAFGTPGDRVAFPAPTFVMLSHFAQANALVPVPVPPRPDGSLDLEGLLATNAEHVYLCSPNNPTGAVLPSGALERVLASTRGLVILDEAYAEFIDASHAKLAATHGRLLVARTLSKAFALAGLRVGYGIATPEMATAIEKSRGPYNVSAVAEQVALAAVTQDVAWVRQHVATVGEVRERFIAALRALGFAPQPSSANFVLLPVPDAATIDAALLAQDVAVRAFTALPVFGDALRITLAPWEQLEHVLDALRPFAPGEGRS